MRKLSGVGRGIVLGGLALLALGCDGRPTEVAKVPLPQAQRFVALAPAADSAALGRLVFNDVNMSVNRNQSCAACHDLAWGGTGPDPAINAAGGVYEGSVPGRFGNRKPPSSAYAAVTPVMFYDKQAGFVGGSFWDGRATGLTLGDPAAEQAQGPFLNPKEQGLPSSACVVYRAAITSPYTQQYAALFGNDAQSIAFPANMDELCATEGAVVSLSPADQMKVNAEYVKIARAIAAWERSPEVMPYSSKFDAWKSGQATLSAEEERGWALFNGKGKCARCHVPRGPRANFTDFTYDNLGLPKNPLNPATIAGATDEGLGAFLATQPELASYAPLQMGKFKVATLRNVDRRPAGGGTKAFMHNGVFKSLEQVVHFYNTRDVLPRCTGPVMPAEMGQSCWPAPEVAQHMNTRDLGHLGLSAVEEQALVAFMKTLTDGYFMR